MAVSQGQSRKVPHMELLPVLSRRRRGQGWLLLAFMCDSMHSVASQEVLRGSVASVFTGALSGSRADSPRG